MFITPHCLTTQPQMPNKTSGNRLFLTCPTDGMEQPILKEFKGESFFYTALGVYLELDFKAQSSLWNLIYENDINQIVFVSSVDNIFYKNLLEERGKHNSPVDRILYHTQRRIFYQFTPLEAFSSHYYLLAASYLKDQVKRLLSTDYLGAHLIKEQIAVEAFVYHPEDKVFYDHHDIEEKRYLLNTFSYN